MSCSVSILLLVVAISCGLSNADYSRAYGNFLKDNSTGIRMCVTDPLPSNVTLTQTKYHCGGICSWNQACLQFNYYEDSKVCEMFSNLGGRNCSSANTYCKNYRIKSHPSRATVPARNTNIALFRPAYQSSTYSINGISRTAPLAVDGNYDMNAFNGHCSNTNDGGGGPNWWAVDLGTPFFIDRVVLTNRDSYGNRLNNFIIGVTNISPQQVAPVRGAYPLCGQYPYATAANAQFTLFCNVTTPPGRYVIAQQPANGGGYFTICELEVYAKCF